MAFISEAQLETALLEQLTGLGYACVCDEDVGPDGRHPERAAHDEVVFRGRLAAAVARLNPQIPAEAQQDAVRRLTQSEFPNLLEENRRLHRLLVEGADVEYYGAGGFAVRRPGRPVVRHFRHVPRPDPPDTRAG